MGGLNCIAQGLQVIANQAAKFPIVIDHQNARTAALRAVLYIGSHHGFLKLAAAWGQSCTFFGRVLAEKVRSDPDARQ